MRFAGLVRENRLEAGQGAGQPQWMTKRSPFRYFKMSPEIIRLAMMRDVRFPLSLRNVEDHLHERGIDISHQTLRFWWNRFGPMFAAEIQRNRIRTGQE
jgi:putative transposase